MNEEKKRQSASLAESTREDLASHRDMVTATIGRHVQRLVEAGKALSIETLETELRQTSAARNTELEGAAADKALEYLSDMSPRSSPGN